LAKRLRYAVGVSILALDVDYDDALGLAWAATTSLPHVSSAHPTTRAHGARV